MQSSGGNQITQNIYIEKVKSKQNAELDDIIESSPLEKILNVENSYQDFIDAGFKNVCKQEEKNQQKNKQDKKFKKIKTISFQDDILKDKKNEESRLSINNIDENCFQDNVLNGTKDNLLLQPQSKVSSLQDQKFSIASIGNDLLYKQNQQKQNNQGDLYQNNNSSLSSQKNYKALNKFLGGSQKQESNLVQFQQQQNQQNSEYNNNGSPSINFSQSYLNGMQDSKYNGKIVRGFFEKKLTVNSNKSLQTKKNIQTNSNAHQIILKKLNQDRRLSLQEKELDWYKMKLNEPPKKLSEHWAQLKKRILFHIKLSTFFSPFLIQKQINDLSAAKANHDNQGTVDDDMEKKMRKQRNNFFENLIYKILQKYEKINLFNPNQKYSYSIDILLFLVNILVLFYLSVNIAFEFGQVYESEFFRGIYFYLIPFFFILDMVKELTTAVYVKGSINRDHKFIFLRYLKSLFIFDLLSFIPFFSFLLDTQAKQIMNLKRDVNYYNIIFKAFIILKIKSMKAKENRILKYFQTKQSLQLWSELLLLISFILTLSHICSITYHTLAQVEIEYLGINSDTWLHQANLLNAPPWARYLKSIFCSTSSMITILIYVPQTHYEEFYQTVIMVINCGVFGYSINELGNILADLRKNQKDLKSDLNSINRYLDRKKVSNNLKAKVRNYLEYIHTQKKELNSETTNQILKKLSPNLQEDLVKEVNEQNLMNCTFFTKNFSKNIIQKLYDIGQELTFSSDEIIIRENNPYDLDFYYIINGAVQVYHQVGKRDLPQTQVGILQKGDYFGHLEFINGQPRQASISSLEFTTVLKIQREKFIKILKVAEEKGNKKDWEHFCMMKDYVNFNKLYKIGDKCFTCHNSNHISKFCPSTHLIFNKIKTNIIMKSQDQIRVRYFRLSEIRINSLIKSDYIYEECVQFVINNEILLQKYDHKWHYHQRNIDEDYSDNYYNSSYFQSDYYDEELTDFGENFQNNNDYDGFSQSEINDKIINSDKINDMNINQSSNGQTRSNAHLKDDFHNLKNSEDQKETISNIESPQLLNKSQNQENCLNQNQNQGNKSKYNQVSQRIKHFKRKEIKQHSNMHRMFSTENISQYIENKQLNLKNPAKKLERFESNNSYKNMILNSKQHVNDFYEIGDKIENMQSNYQYANKNNNNNNNKQMRSTLIRNQDSEIQSPTKDSVLKGKNVSRRQMNVFRNQNIRHSTNEHKRQNNSYRNLSFKMDTLENRSELHKDYDVNLPIRIADRMLSQAMGIFMNKFNFQISDQIQNLQRKIQKNEILNNQINMQNTGSDISGQIKQKKQNYFQQNKTIRTLQSIQEISHSNFEEENEIKINNVSSKNNIQLQFLKNWEQCPVKYKNEILDQKQYGWFENQKEYQYYFNKQNVRNIIKEINNFRNLKCKFMGVEFEQPKRRGTYKNSMLMITEKTNKKMTWKRKQTIQ